MAENPDQVNESTRDLVPSTGELRFVLRDGKRILQRYEWSYTDQDHGWYDIPLHEEE